MAIPRPPEKALFLTGMLVENAALLPLAAAALAARFGPPFLASLVHPFTNTDYYLDELGPRPLRAFLAWPAPYRTETLADAKLATNAMELDLARQAATGSPRPVNLDPGYLTQAKLVLASAKNYAHRIHLRDNIYAELTLQYRDRVFHTLPWTFPDFAATTYHAFFHLLREKVADIR